MHRIAICSLVLGAVMAGCGERARYYLLDTRAPAVSTERSSGIWLGIRPITLPGYLNRAQIVTRATAHRLDVAPLDLWAEPLKTNVANVLKDALAQRLSADRIVLLAQEPANTDYNVSVDIEHFERQPDGAVLLAAEWTIEHAESGAPEAVGANVIREQVTGDDYNAIVDTMSRTLGGLSQRIAAEASKLKPTDAHG